jgi:hypothetical protein
MATWIEMRCENRSEGTEGCWSDENGGPMDMAADDQKSVLAVLKSLHDQAKKEGWVKTRDGWVCPVCSGNEVPASVARSKKAIVTRDAVARAFHAEKVG